MSPFYIKSLMMHNPNLTDIELRETTGSLLKPQNSKESYFADITYVDEFNNYKSPKRKVIKMSKTEYIDDFFNNGTLQLGTFNYYKKFENPEIGDLPADHDFRAVLTELKLDLMNEAKYFIKFSRPGYLSIIE